MEDGKVDVNSRLRRKVCFIDKGRRRFFFFFYEIVEIIEFPFYWGKQYMEA